MLVFCLAALSVPARGYEDLLPDADDALDRAAQAMGGGWGTHLRRLSAKAIVSSPDGASRVMVDSAYPDRLHFEQTFFDGRHFSGWVNSGAAWYREGNDPRPHPLTDTERAILRANEWHVMCLDLAHRFSDFEATAWEPVAGRRSLRLDMTDELGRPAAAFLDVESFLPVALELAGGTGGRAVSIRFASWQSHDGLQLFHKATVVDGPSVRHYVFTDLELDRPEGDEFETPAGLAMP